MARDERYAPLVYGTIFVIVGFIFLSISISSFYGDLQFLWEGRIAKATVISRDPDADNDGGMITYNFKDKFEHSHNGTAIMDRQVFNSISVGDRCLVTYLLDNPQISRLKIGYNDSEQIQMSILGTLVAMTTGSLVICYGILRIKRLKRLPLIGVKIVAKVALEHWEEQGSDSPLTKYFALTYTYTIQTKCYIYGFRLNDEDLAIWIETDHLSQGITVYYDPNDPGFHVAMLVPGQLDQGLPSMNKGGNLLKSSNPELSELMI